MKNYRVFVSFCSMETKKMEINGPYCRAYSIDLLEKRQNAGKLKQGFGGHY
jgi:hypothetical protein